MDLLSLLLLTAVFTIRDLPVEAAEVTFGDSTGNVTVLMWGQARLPCIVTGQGLGTNQNVVWFQSTRGLALTLNRFILPSEFSKGNRLAFTAPGSKEDWGLLINDVRQSDDGVYQCVVNTRPVRKKHVNLRVVSPPTLSSDLPQSISVTAGNYVLLECEASGIPVPVVNWFRINDTRVLVGEGEQYLMPYIMPDQAGTYQCTADNGVPPAGYLQFNVEVLFRPTAEIVAPSRTDILLGSDVTITARCTSNPKSSARWLKDDVALSFTDPPDRYGFWNKHDTFSLKIQRVTEQDLGFFMVDCENVLARSVQKVELRRLEAPQIDLERSSRNQTVLVGETLDLQCHSTTPESNFSWYRTDDHEIDHVTEVPIGTGNTLTLPSVQIPDAGLFACMTGNMAGYTIHFIAVDVKDTTVTPEGTTDAGPTTRADIICEDNRISIHVPADLLPTGREVTWNDPSCVVTNNGTHLVGTIGLDSCGTVVHFNDTHVVFENDLVSESTNGTNAIDFGLNSVIPVQCVYPRRQEVSTSFLPVAGHARFYEKGMGHLQVQMRHARDVTFDETYDVGPVAHQVTLNKPVYLKLTLGVVNQTISDISINVDRCFATPSSSLLDSELQELTDNGCPASPSVMVYPSPGSEVHFSFRAFRFTGHPNNPVYVHCQVFVCSTSNSDCIPGCNNNGRKRRAAVGGPNTHLVSSGPYRLSSDQAAGSSSALVAVTGLCVFLAVAATVFGVLAWRGRKRLAVHYKEFT